MHRNKLLTLLDRYQRRYPREDVAGFRRFVGRQPRCFERDCWDDGHITGSALVLNAAASAVLLTHHAKLGKWLQLGGHADGDHDPLAVARREAAEESGLAVTALLTEALDLDVHRIPAHGADPAHYHYDVRFLLQARGGDEFTVTAESLALRWVPLDAVASLTRETSMLRMAAKCRQFIDRHRGRKTGPGSD